MINKSDASDVKPFTGLSPDVVLDAASSVGLEVDGRLFALNSYENRVYQLGSPGGSLVLKFYRPERWTDEQIGEEHEFTAEMAAAELPVAAEHPSWMLPMHGSCWGEVSRGSTRLAPCVPFGAVRGWASNVWVSTLATRCWPPRWCRMSCAIATSRPAKPCSST
jgi:hypothetical protein